jgi:hypothetical protein
MNQVRRITPEEVVAAYRKTGLRPIRGVYCERVKGAVCGCPIAVLYLASIENPPDNAFRIATRSAKWGAAEFGEYEVPFIAGFDQPDDVCEYGSPIGILAHADGVAVFKAVSEAFPEVFCG